VKLKLLTALIEKLIGESDVPRADMYLPNRMIAFCIVLAAAAVGFIIAFIVNASPILAVIAAACVLLGVLSLLCWKNQKIIILDEDTFEYSTFLGNKRVYAFSDIEYIRRNQDSLTMFVRGDKVHMESMAILSDRLIQKINRAIGADQPEEEEEE